VSFIYHNLGWILNNLPNNRQDDSPPMVITIFSRMINTPSNLLTLMLSVMFMRSLLGGSLRKSFPLHVGGDLSRTFFQCVVLCLFCSIWLVVGAWNYAKQHNAK